MEVVTSPQHTLQASVKLLEDYRQGTLDPAVTNKQVSCCLLDLQSLYGYTHGVNMFM